VSDIELTAQRLREVLAYDAKTGVFTRRLRCRNGVKVGDVAGGKHRCGYIVIKVLGQTYLAHRLAWLYVHGVWPSGEIDHMDGRRDNNTFANLRDVSRSVNQQNQRQSRSDSTHGYLGVTRNGTGWAARIWMGGKHRHLGTFASPELAHVAYINAKRQLHAGCTI
jgi:hypothetical protein